MKAKLVFVLVNFIALVQNALPQNQLTVTTETRSPIPFTEYSAVIAAPKDSSTIFISSKLNGVFHTTDGGANWQQVMRDAAVYDLLVINQAVFAARADGIFKSTDKGESWTKALNISARSFLTLRGIIYVRTFSDDLFLSKDGGATWQRTEPLTTEKPSYWQKNRCWMITAGAAAVMVIIYIALKPPGALADVPPVPSGEN